MRKVLKWGGITVGSLLTLLLLALAGVYTFSNARMRTTYAVASYPLSVSSDSATVAKGKHIATIRGCTDCHGADLGGSVMIDDPMLGRIAATNLTSGAGGVAPRYTDADWGKAIRHGVRPDGSPLLVMPSQEFNVLSDDDLTALVSYIKHLPPVDRELPKSFVGPLGRTLYLADQLQLIPAELIDHQAERKPAPTPGPTAEYGAYLAASCTGCHGASFTGGKVPGTPPDAPPASNLTPDPATGLGDWTEEDFFRALREGVRPDGTELNPLMPWKMTAAMTDEEIQALWRFLQTLPATARQPS